MLSKSNPFFKHLIRKSTNLRRREGSVKTSSVLANSIPKSGTHLLTEVLEAFGYKDFWGFYASTPSTSMREQSVTKGARAMRYLLQNEVFPAHMFYSTEANDQAIDLQLPVIQLVRDPAAIFISELNYISSMNKWHRYHRLLAPLKTEEERFRKLLKGVDSSDFFFPSFSKRITPYIEWTRSPHALTVSFESLRGDGCEAELNRISHYLSRFNPSVSEITIAEVAEKITATRTSSHTFTGLNPDRWKQISGKLREELQEEVRDVRVALGYPGE